jgi:hypothetical protein
MRPDHTATELVPAQPSLAALLEGDGNSLPAQQMGALARITFCFAWLFGLEPFLTGTVGETPRSRSERH